MNERRPPHAVATTQAPTVPGRTTPARQIEEVYRRIARYDDAAIFIALRPVASTSGGRAGSRAPRAGGVAALSACRSPSRTISTSPACHDGGLPGLRLRARASDASAVARLRAAGALIVGKTNLDQFATGLVGIRSPYGVPRNALRRRRRAGRIELRLGRRGGAPDSCRSRSAPTRPVRAACPAGLNNIVGLKPTLGARVEPPAWCRPAARSTASRSSR